MSENLDQGWTAVRRACLDLGLAMPDEDQAKAISTAAVDAVIRRGHVHTLQQSRALVTAEVAALRRAER